MAPTRPHLFARVAPIEAYSRTIGDWREEGSVWSHHQICAFLRSEWKTPFFLSIFEVPQGRTLGMENRKFFAVGRENGNFPVGCLRHLGLRLPTQVPHAASPIGRN